MLAHKRRAVVFHGIAETFVVVETIYDINAAWICFFIANISLIICYYNKLTFPLIVFV